jgi:hypothetical protein
MIRSTEKSNELIGNRTRDLVPCVANITKRKFPVFIEVSGMAFVVPVLLKMDLELHITAVFLSLVVSQRF